jgi:hypothetical protein
MKTLLSQTVCFLALVGIVLGGTEFSPDSKVQDLGPSVGWYAAGEFNVQLSGVYAATKHQFYRDQYIKADHGWGGSIDLKYFVNRHVAFGLEGYAFSATQTRSLISVFGPFTTFTTLRDEPTIGAGLVTLTFRAPVGTSRFAPFGFLGAGVIAGGGRHLQVKYLGFTGVPPGTNPYQPYFTESSTEAVGQLGGGLEIRLSRHLGFVNDFSWNVIDGRDNNFGMARSGLNVVF